MSDYLYCDDCGKQKEDARETVCPYAEEIHGEIIEVILCEDCEHERCMEI